MSHGWMDYSEVSVMSLHPQQRDRPAPAIAITAGKFH